MDGIFGETFGVVREVTIRAKAHSPSMTRARLRRRLTLAPLGGPWECGCAATLRIGRREIEHTAARSIMAL
jgi:hypothetical protein